MFARKKSALLELALGAIYTLLAVILTIVILMKPVSGVALTIAAFVVIVVLNAVLFPLEKKQ